ncbi:MAG: hypothetical protein Q9220_000648 [cf. Caloplaca sp. 1 TL-2023]
MNADAMKDSDPDSAAEAQAILLAASRHDVESLRLLLRNTSASVQDPSTGFTPLHAAVAGVASFKKTQSSNEDGVSNNNGKTDDDRENETNEAAIRSVKLLLENGAIWNDLSKDDETPGCLALRINRLDLYNIIVDAGVRAEILLSHLDSYQQLSEHDSSDDENDNTRPNTPPPATTTTESIPITIIQPPSPSHSEPQPNQPTYLSSTLSFSPNRILDASANTVMASWETSIMTLTASLLAPHPGCRILNIGHGMGIIDSQFQSASPQTHHIVEAHPSILACMREQGWYEKKGVVVHEGRWQDVLPRLLEQQKMFDAIYFDTFAEPYTALRTLFEDFVVGLLDDENGRWGYFNGLGADRQVCYDVYGKVVEMDLFESGFEVEWRGVPVPDLEAAGEWEGVKSKYFRLREYRLPIVRFMK